MASGSRCRRRGAVELQAAAHPLDPQVDDGQAEPGAFDAAAVAAAEEGLEHPRQVVGGDPAAGVAHLDLQHHAAGRGAIGGVADGQLDAALAGELGGVLDEVADDLHAPGVHPDHAGQPVRRCSTKRLWLRLASMVASRASRR
jgi:hypothetical protein